uniref:Alpha-type protein kinase domain-containing protein n=1 Tax=Myripristis murdjan TaxID=586833 RepID=A0A667YMU2_9TELE
MDSQEVGALLEDCLRAANAKAKAKQPSPPSGEAGLSFCRYRDSLCAELASLLHEAVEMKWPFVPEKWQYKQAVSTKDKTNLTDLISQHLHQLLALLKAAIMAQEARWALAVVFLVDRFLYWTDDSSRLLKITKLLHRCHPDAPVAPQLVIRQARVYLNAGKLQKAEYILSSLINNSGATGCWVYHSESDRALVQAVSVQVRGLVLQKLGLWLEAAELIWASLVGYYALPQPDKKGIGMSLGILANLLVSMNDEDYHAFRTNPDVDLSALGDRSHRLLSAAEAAKMAVVYSQYTSLFVLTHVATQGTCLLSYSFSAECPSSERDSYLLQAKEAFEVGLLTKTEGELVTSKQELHTFLKAAYSLTVTHKWLGTSSEVLTQATQACQKALALFYDYCHAASQERDSLCADIMHLVVQVKLLLQVEPFPSSDRGSFIPDSYRNIKDRPVNFTLAGFARVMGRFQKYHASLCEATDVDCNRRNDTIDGARLCITALGTTIGTLNTECTTQNYKVQRGEQPQQKALQPPQKVELSTTQGSTDDLGASWQNFSLSGSGSPHPGTSGYTGSNANVRKANVDNQSLPTTEVDDDSMLEFTEKNKKQDKPGHKSSANSHAVPRSLAHVSSSCNTGSDSEKFEVIEAAQETVGSEEDWIPDVVDGSLKPTGTSGAAQSLSQLTLRTSSSSLNDSFSSRSSWEKISSYTCSPANNNPNPAGQSKPIGLSSKSTESDESFYLIETPDSEASDSTNDPKHQSATSGRELRATSNPQPLQSFDVDPNAETEMCSVPGHPEPAAKNPNETPQPNIELSVPEQCASTEISPDSSFEMLEAKEIQHPHDKLTSTEKVNSAPKKNPSCYSCLKHNIAISVVPESKYLLTQQDYHALLAGVCHECLHPLQLPLNPCVSFSLGGLHLKFSRATGLWTARETCLYVGDEMGEEGKQRRAIWVQFLHQEERLSNYVGKDYLEPKEIQFHFKDVERQMTAQYYVTEFNKSLYDKEIMAQIFFIPSEALLILSGDEIVGCITVEPYMLGDFVKLTNNTVKKDMRFQATEYGIAFGHFTYLFSDCQEVVVDLQGWVTANGKGLTYLTDPQIHSSKTPMGRSNFAERGLRCFLEEQHGPECNDICRKLKLRSVAGLPHVA